MNLNVKRIIAFSIILASGIWLLYLLTSTVSFENTAFKKFNDFQSFYNYRLAISEKLGAKKGNEEKLLRISEKPTEYAVLYIHGFLASRAEGEYIVDRVSKRYKMNAYYLRLPGHGTNMNDHASQRAEDYINLVEQALYHMRFLGKKTIVMATSTGGVLSFYLASKHPDKIDSMIIASPFLDFASPAARVMYYPGGIELVQLLYGNVRKAQMDPKDERYIYDEYKKHWYTENKFEAFRALVNLRSAIFTKEILEKVNTPLLMFIYPKDEVASAESMQKAFKMMPQKNKTIRRIENGNHILFSEFVRSDKEKILDEINKYMIKIQTKKEI